MIQVEVEDLCSTETVCGIWINRTCSAVEHLLYFLLDSVIPIRCIAFCGIGETSFRIDEMMQRIKAKYPYLRIAIIGNLVWYENMPCLLQNKLLQLLDEADFYIPCPFPVNDSFSFLSYCSDYLIVENCAPPAGYTEIINGERNIKVYKLR